MLVGLRLQLALPDGETDNERPTVPEKLLAGAVVMVEVIVAPFVELIVLGFAVTVKSLIVTVTVAECARAPLVPVTVTV